MLHLLKSDQNIFLKCKLRSEGTASSAGFKGQTPWKIVTFLRLESK